MSVQFSIVIAFYNQKAVFQETLDSILNQDFTDYEVVVINDGSSEEHTNWVSKYTNAFDQVRLIHQENTGPGSARNRGIEASKGQYIIFLDGDDLMAKGALQAFHTAVQKNKGSDVIISDCSFFGVKQEIKHQYLPTFPQLLAFNNMIICAAVKRALLGDQIRFDAKMDRIGLEDWEFWIQCLKKGAQFSHIPQVLFNIRTSENSRTTNTANLKKKEAFKIIYSNHAELVQLHLEGLILENRQLKNSINTKIGDVVLTPYRLLKKVLGK